MYSLLYRKLPGGKFAKFMQLLLLATGFIAFLFFIAFPELASLIPEDPSING